MRLKVLITFVVLASTAPSLAVSANFFDELSEETSQAFDALTPDGWLETDVKLALGGGLAVVPDYKGSSDYNLQKLPIIDIRVGGFRLQGNEIRYILTSSPVRAGITARLDFGRGDDGNGALAGLGGIGTSLESGAFAEALWKGWAGRLEIRQDILGGHDGLVANLSGGRLEEISERLDLVYGLRLNWGDRSYRQSFFGVDTRQAAASGYPVHDVGAGITDIGARFIASYDLTDKLRVDGLVGYERLLGSAASSPFVKGPGSPNQFTVGFAFRYTLWRRRGPDDEKPAAEGESAL